MRNLLALTIISVGLMSCSPQVNYNRPVPSPGPKGDRGDVGERGETGADGKDAQSCTVVQMVNGATITCPDGSTTAILNGAPGADGLPAPASAYTVVEVINPCGSQAAFDEILLKLANGQIMAHFASGSQQFLSLIGPGNYTTTDNTSCKFTVTNSGDIINEHN